MQTDELAKLLALPDLPADLKRIEKTLVNLVSTSSPSLKEPCLRLLKNSGKRVRPILVMAAVQSLGIKVDQNAINGCTSVELIHMGTIVHDDIIDSADFRWGMPTINKQEGSDQAILVGDYLLALAVLQATSISQEVGRAVAETIADMCDGQSQETADEYNEKRTIDDYNSVISKKTAALTSLACRVGGLCAGLPLKQVESLADYGESFGMAFQLIDDLLDFLSTAEAMGKPVGNDLKEGVYTYPILFALGTSHKNKVESWLGKKPTNQPSKDEVTKLLIESGAVEATLKVVRSHNKVAEKAIRKLGDSGTINGLANLPDIYLDWAIKKFPASAK